MISKISISLNGVETSALDNKYLSVDLKEREYGYDLEIRAKEEVDGALSIHLTSDLWSGKVFIPAIWYDGNKEGEGLFPSIKRAPYWTFHETRMTIAGIIGLEEDEGWTYAYLDECKDEISLASSGWDSDGIVMRFPPHESPFSYRGKTSLIESGDPPLLHFSKGMCIKRKIFIKTIKERDVYTSYSTLIKDSFNSDVKLLGGWEDYKRSKLKRLKNLIIETEDRNKALIMGRGNGEVQSVYEFTAGSFLVKSVEAASAFIKADRDMRDDAISIGKYFLSSEKGDGFYQDSVNLKTLERGGYLGISEHPEFKYLMNARCAGEASYSFITLYEETGIEEFLNISKRIARFFIKHQLKTGSFGRWWDKEGNAIDEKGTNGAYIATMLIKLLPYLDEDEKKSALDAIVRARGWYQELSLSHNFHGDTLDADSVDKEAGVAILSFLLSCIENGIADENTIKASNEAASFILTWMWQGRSYIPPLSPLGKLNFNTEGMTSVSAAHHHLDFYGMLIAELYFRLYKITKDKLWLNMGKKLMNACLSLIANEENGYLGRSKSFDGWQPEQINYTYWDYFSKEEMMAGSFSIDIAWVNVLGLSSYLSIKEKFPDIFSG